MKDNKNKITEPLAEWVNYSPVEYITRPENTKLFEALGITTDLEKYNNFISWKFEQTYKHCKNYDMYKFLLYLNISDLNNEGDIVYNNLNGICYYITNNDKLADLYKYGIYQEAKDPFNVIERVPIFVFRNYTDAEKLLKENEVIITLNLSNNNYKISLYKNLNIPGYDVFTFESISPGCIIKDE